MARTKKLHLDNMHLAKVSADGESVEFGFRSADGTSVEVTASTDAVDIVMHNLEQLAIEALKRRLEAGTDRSVAPKSLPAFRSICNGIVLEAAEPADNFEGYRLLAFRWSRPPIMMLLTPALFEDLSRSLMSRWQGAPPPTKH